MEFFLNDPQVPRVPPEKTRILDLHIESYPDSQRFRVSLDLTPFERRPYIDLTVTDPAGNQVGSTSIVEPTGWKLELTLHLHKEKPVAGKYNLIARLSYPDLGDIDRRELTFVLPTSTE